MTVDSIEQAREFPPATPAGTVAVIRDGTHGIETLMLRRNPSSSTFAGMWVFPGGKVDEDDRVDGRGEIESARFAAVREASEEAGLVLEADDLVALARWEPPARLERRFAAWIFLAAVSDALVEIDGGEIHDHAWLEAADVLRRRDAGEMELAPPTWVTLHTLGSHRDVASVLAWAASNDPQRYLTRLIGKPPAAVLTWHGDAAYESGDLGADGARHRLVMDPTSWRYERD